MLEQIELQQLRILQDLIISLKLQVDQADKIIKELRIKLLEVNHGK